MRKKSKFMFPCPEAPQESKMMWTKRESHENSIKQNCFVKKTHTQKQISEVNSEFFSDKRSEVNAKWLHSSEAHGDDE